MYPPSKGRSPKWSKVLVVGVLCLGIFFRVVNLDKKVFWVDEVATALRVSGYTLEEMVSDLVDGPVKTLPQIQKYQYPSPEKSLLDTATSLAAEDVHPPLFFSLLRFWVMLFGNSVTALRSLAALFSILMFPAIWWLCRELFTSDRPQNTPSKQLRNPLPTNRSTLIGWTAVALLATSPAQIVFAQESRQYTLWMLLILLASASLLRSLKTRSRHAWALYSLCILLGLYTHYLFALIVASHALYVLCTQQFKPTQNAIAYLLASAIAGIGYLPWLIFSQQFPTDTAQLDWAANPPGPISMSVQVAGVLSRSFVDLGAGTIDSSAAIFIVAPFLLLALSICLAALVSLVRQTPFRIWFFIATLGGVTAAVILGSYFILDTAIATTRFVLPIALSLQIAVAYLLVTGIQPTARAFRKSFFHQHLNQAVLWRSLTGLLLSIGIISATLRVNEALWWTQMPNFNQHIPEIAQTINQQPNALVIMDASKNAPFFDVVQPQSLLHSIDRNAQVNLQIVEEAVPDLTTAKSESIFLYLPINASGMQGSPESLQTQMADKYNVSLKPIIPGTFWRISSANATASATSHRDRSSPSP